MANYLVTGGAGFIGSHLVRRLAAAEHNVKVLDNFSTGSRENIPRGTANADVVEGDVRDPATVRAVTLSADYVLHLAAQISVPLSIEDPAATDEINTRGTLNALMAAQEAGVKRFVLASSCAVYGDNPCLPLREDYLPRPLSPYAVTKLAGEQYCEVFSNAFGLPSVALRFFNVFGPGQRPDSQYAAAIPKFADAVASGGSITIFGDGEQTRDFIFVENVVSAILLACESDVAVGRVVNVGSGNQTSLNELMRILADVAGRDIVPIYGPPRAGDIRHSCADISLARELLGYECKVSLEEGLQRVMQTFTAY
ncbi:MAG: SDR family oxidoreductase [Armatimonadetes bacterium]|nr:SDR family oxidoreductase [Armatimonadota bacterium]